MKRPCAATTKKVALHLYICTCLSALFFMFLFIQTDCCNAASVSEKTSSFHAMVSERSPEELSMRDFMSVCPPFYLRDEAGNVIDPVHDINTDAPYSPEKTCGRCHDYERITSGYHFQQGKNEKLSHELAAMYPWMRTPGQYGGRY